MKRCLVVFAEKEKGVLSVPRPEFLLDRVEEAPLRLVLWCRRSWGRVAVSAEQEGGGCRVTAELRH